MKQRILAIVGAVGLVVVAVVARTTLFGDDADGPGGSKGRGKPVVACSPDLAPVCDALAAAGTIAASPPTLDLDDATAPPDDLDGWITWDAAPGVANLDAPGTWSDVEAVGGSAVAVARRSGPAPALPTGCSPNAITWRCVADAALDGSAVAVGTGTTAESLARLHPVAGALVPQDGDFTDIDASTLRAILASPTDPQDLFPTQLVTLRTKVGAITFLVGPKGALDAASGVVVLSPTPAAEVSVVLATARGGDVDDVAGALVSGSGADALRDAGVTPGQGRLAPDDRAGEQYAVRDKVG